MTFCSEQLKALPKLICPATQAASVQAKTEMLSQKKSKIASRYALRCWLCQSLNLFYFLLKGGGVRVSGFVKIFKAFAFVA